MLTAMQSDRAGEGGIGGGGLSDLLVASLTALCASYNRWGAETDRQTDRHHVLHCCFHTPLHCTSLCRAFIHTYIHTYPCTLSFPLNMNMTTDQEHACIYIYTYICVCLCASRCLASLSKLRSGHMSLVHDYIIAQQKLGTSPASSASSSGSGGSSGSDGKSSSIEKNAGGKGTGGTDLMHFLKVITGWLAGWLWLDMHAL